MRGLRIVICYVVFIPLVFVVLLPLVIIFGLFRSILEWLVKVLGWLEEWIRS